MQCTLRCTHVSANGELPNSRSVPAVFASAAKQLQTCEANRELSAFYTTRKFIIRCSKKESEIAYMRFGFSQTVSILLKLRSCGM